MKDIKGKEIAIGDKVVFVATDRGSNTLKIGTVVNIEKNIGYLCTVKSGSFESKIKDTNRKVMILDK